MDERNGIDLLGNIMESSSISVNRDLYGDLHNLGHVFISYSHDPDHRHLESFGVMGDSATAMRDPIFYRWHAYIDDLFQEHKQRLPQVSLKYLKTKILNLNQFDKKKKCKFFPLNSTRANNLTIPAFELKVFRCNQILVQQIHSKHSGNKVTLISHVVLTLFHAVMCLLDLLICNILNSCTTSMSTIVPALKQWVHAEYSWLPEMMNVAHQCCSEINVS